MLLNKILILNYLLTITHSFSIGLNNLMTNDVNKYINYGNNKIKIIKPKLIKKNQTNAIIFISGGSSFISSNLYSNFHNRLVENNNTIYIPSFNFKENNELINSISKKHPTVTIMGHSSGATTCINFCKKNSNIKSIILLDPVDTTFNNYKIDIPHVKNILFIYAGKSYRFSFNPPGVPFIPFAQLKKKKFKKINNIKVIELNKDNFGHSDILNYGYSNFMHHTRLSVGHYRRKRFFLYKYHKWMANTISEFIKNNLYI